MYLRILNWLNKNLLGNSLPIIVNPEHAQQGDIYRTTPPIVGAGMDNGNVSREDAFDGRDTRYYPPHQDAGTANTPKVEDRPQQQEVIGEDRVQQQEVVGQARAKQQDVGEAFVQQPPINNLSQTVPYEALA